jgi:hypothetical protein
MTVALATRALLPGELSEDGISLPADLSFEDWRETVNNAEWLDRASPWILADVLTYGEQKWGEDHSDALPTYEEDPSGQRQSRMKQALWMGRRFPPGTRVPGLTYSHHRAVADLPPLEATRLLYDAAGADEYVSTREMIGRVKACQEALRGKVVSASSEPIEDAALAWMPSEDDLTDEARAAMEQYAPQGRHRVAYVTGWLRAMVWAEQRDAFREGAWRL